MTNNDNPTADAMLAVTPQGTDEAMQRLVAAMPGLVGGLDSAIKDQTGEFMPVMLLVFSSGTAAYISNFNPEEITLAQVIRAMEGPIGMTDCTSDPGSCDKEPSCPVRVNWQRISTAVNDALERIPLSDMVGPNAVAPLLEVGSPIPWAVGAGTTGPGRPGMGREPGR